ncbi:MAG: DUF1553 domain-containing protein [Cyclobacteriaceae bacterium]
MLRLLIFGLLLCAVACQQRMELPPEVEAKLPEKLDYNFHVKPILSDRCFACHGPDQNNREGGLRLDEEASALSALESGAHAIVPGKPRSSELVSRIYADDPEVQMPPPESNLQLTDYEKAVLTRWVEEGAAYKPHWSFIPPEKPEVPEVENTKWPKNEIDNFVLRQAEQKDVQPSSEADRETLIRRVTFDLTGLPPTLEEINAFLEDDSPNAYEKVVDRLLASPAYGERMAAYWMDVARYADSYGYLDDKHRPMWPWRDWVIEAYNKNLPYDQFITWQLAGDLLPDATQEQILATAFNRNHNQNSEAGIIYEEYRVEYVADRTNTLGKAFLGLTLECARCHDHKYDPISQKEYYQMFAFFNSTFEIGSPSYGVDQTPGPALLLADSATEEEITSLKQTIARHEQQVATHHKKAAPKVVKAKVQADIAQNVRKNLVAYYPFDVVTNDQSPNKIDSSKPATFKDPIPVEGVYNGAIKIDPNNHVTLGQDVGLFERTDPFTVSLWIKPAKTYSEGTVFQHNYHKRYGYTGYTLLLLDNKLSFQLSHSYPHNAIQVMTTEALPENEWAQVTLTYDGSSKASGTKIFVNGEPADTEVVYDNLYKSIIPKINEHTYEFEGFYLGMRGNHTTFPEGLIDELKVFDRDLTALEVKQVYGEANPVDQATPEELQEYYLAHYDPQYQQQLKEVHKLRAKEHTLIDSIPEIMVMGDLPEPRQSYILERGVYDAHGEEVSPTTPEHVLGFPDSLPANRLGLARWMISPDNPLTARVAVNRIWQMHFGKGLVSTSDDFGNQGELPTHPELLDWLAVKFRESGWDKKAMHKLIAMSATYRQSSVITPEMLEMDPDNALLARGPRYRLSAEMIRDNALSVSGLLAEHVGGPSVYPYQPEGLWDELSNKPWRYKYEQAEGEDLYRRSLYTVWKRTSPPPSMLIFDAADRGVCTVNRRNTSTPLQALVLLNDPQYVEASRMLAERMVLEGGENVEEQLTFGFRLLTGRHPNEKELALLRRMYDEENQRFSEKPNRAIAYLSTGEAPRNKQLNSAKVASLATIANAIMNTDEAYTKK